MLTIRTLVVGDLDANCYLVSNPSSDGGRSKAKDSSEVGSECLIIDPGDDADYITETVVNEKLKPIAIILTHGHFDHVLGCLELKLNFSIPIYLHQSDLKLYTSANQSASHWLKKKTLKVPPIDQFIKEGDKIKIGSESLAVIETPGHTPGSICLYWQTFPLSKGESKGVLFSGDTLFADSVGRTDFSYSSPSDLQTSLTKIKSLNHQTFPLSKGEFKGVTIYPGHGDHFLL